VRAADLRETDAARNAGNYAEKVRGVVAALTAGFAGDAVNLVVAHGMVRGGQAGGGEREAHTAFDEYWIDGSVFPATASYVALGHLHLAQRMPGGPPIWYSGSPIQVDFGEAGAGKHVLVVDASPGRPADVRQVPLVSGAELRTLTGTLDELRAVAASEDLSGAWLRVRVSEPGRAGLAGEVRALFGDRVVDIRLEAPAATTEAPRSARSGRNPRELFAAFLAEQNVEDPRLVELFGELLDAETAA
jgi:exonuclease SbcD